MRPLVIIIFDPQTNPFPCRLKAFKLGAREKLLPDGFPEAFDLPQGHRVMRTGFKMVDPVLFQLGLEAGGATPVDVLPAVVGEHLFGRLVLPDGHTKDFQYVFGGVAAEQIRADHESGIIIHESDQVGVTAAEPKGEDVGLPHLVGSGAFKEAWTHQIAPRFGWRLNQTLFLEGFAYRLRASLEEEYPLEQLGDSFNASGRLLFLEFEDLVADRLSQTWSGSTVTFVLEPFFAVQPVLVHPFSDGG